MLAKAMLFPIITVPVFEALDHHLLVCAEPHHGLDGHKALSEESDDWRPHHSLASIYLSASPTWIIRATLRYFFLYERCIKFFLKFLFLADRLRCKFHIVTAMHVQG